MDTHLKVRLLDAAVVADAMYQRNMAKAISDGIAEIERLHGVMAELQKTYAHVAQQMKIVLPLLRRLERPTEEMRAAMTLGRVPVYVEYADGRWEVRYEQDEVVMVDSYHETQEDANEQYHKCVFHWRYVEMLRVAAEQRV
jgi:hypothetical protein